MPSLRNSLGLILLSGASIICCESYQSRYESKPSRDSLAAQERAILGKWLSHHSEYRIANNEDCQCSDDLKQIRSGAAGSWKAAPDYIPYQVTGDFNGDGYEDFAAVVVRTSDKGNNFALLVFNGPFQSESATPAFVKEGLDLRYKGLFYGPPRPRPYRLVVGRFESDTGLTLVPRGRSYSLNE